MIRAHGCCVVCRDLRHTEVIVLRSIFAILLKVSACWRALSEHEHFCKLTTPEKLQMINHRPLQPVAVHLVSSTVVVSSKWRDEVEIRDVPINHRHVRVGVYLLVALADRGWIKPTTTCIAQRGCQSHFPRQGISSDRVFQNLFAFFFKLCLDDRWGEGAATQHGLR